MTILRSRFLLLYLIVCSSFAFSISREQEAAEVLNLLRKREQDKEVEKRESFKQDFLNTSLAEDQKILNLSLGFHSIESNPQEAIKFLSNALSKQEDEDPLRLVINYYLGLAYLKLAKYKNAAEIADGLISEKDVQDSFEKLALTLGIESYYGLGEFNKVIDLFSTYTRKFSFSRKQEALAQLTIKSLEKKGEFPKSIEIAEELARGYPTTPESRWAFNYLLDLSCDKQNEVKKHNYFFSRRLLMHLARNAIVGNGLEEFIVHTSALPIRHNDSTVKVMSKDERADFLYKARFYHAALKETRELYETEKSKNNSGNIGAYLFDLGRIHLRLFEPMIASMYFSKYIFDYPKSGAMHLVYENMGDALRYSNLPKSAGHFYKLSLEKKDNSLLRWFRFWSLYRSKQYQEALRLLEQYGHSLFRQGDDSVTAKYWHGRILEKVEKFEESTKLYREILAEHGESFYANLIVSRRPELTANSESLVAEESNQKSLSMTLAAKLMSGQDVPQHELDTQLNMGRNYNMIANLIKAGLKDVAIVQLNSLNWGKINHEEAFAAVSRLSYYLKDYLPSRKIRYYSFSPLRAIPTS